MLVNALAPLHPIFNGHLDMTLPNVINISFGDLDSEAVMIALRDIVAISNGSACTSANYEPSHVLKAMGITGTAAQAATRWSWCHLTPIPDLQAITTRIKSLY
jgi:cysteine desulfurase